MKYTKLILLLIVAIGFAACDQESASEIGGREVTQQFLTEYSGEYVEKTDRDDDGERLIIYKNGDIEALKIRNVGEKNNPSIPEGTVCSYIITGQVRYVVELDEMTRQRVDANGEVYYAPKTHDLVFSVHNVALTDQLQENTTTNKACINYETKLNRELPVYAYGMELFGAGSIRLHTTDNDDFVAGERGVGTLDEIFEKE